MPQTKMTTQGNERPSRVTAYWYLSILICAYIGVYLCRKNITVAVPMLQQQWGLDKEQVGMLGSMGTVAYAAGKLAFGPITDRIGGRRSLLASMGLVAVFGLLGALAPTFGPLVVLYSLNRLAGSAGWGAMVKLAPEWFPSAKLPFALGLLSLSFVFGGALAVSLAGFVAQVTHDSTVAVLGIPGIILLLATVICWRVLPKPEQAQATGTGTNKPWQWREAMSLFWELQFLIILALSFTLTLLREIFNFWAVDFVRSEAGGGISNAVASFISTPFDICGGLGIVGMGWWFGRLEKRGRRNLLVATLLTLAVVLYLMPLFFRSGVWALAGGIGLIGFLVYGPYSLLAGVFSVEVRGKSMAATVSGVVDGAGYIAGIFSGALFGKLLSLGGYRLGFEAMALLTIVSAGLCCFLYWKKESGTPRQEAAELAAGNQLNHRA